MSIIQNIKEIQYVVKQFEDAFEKGRQNGIKEGMERAVVIAENLYLPECHRECIEPRVCRTVAESIRKEIDND